MRSVRVTADSAINAWEWMNRIEKFKNEIVEKWATILWPSKFGMVGNEKEM
jgi:hypothetical protein